MIITAPVDSVSVAGSTSSNASHTKPLDPCFQDSACKKAEIMLVLKHACFQIVRLDRRSSWN